MLWWVLWVGGSLASGHGKQEASPLPASHGAWRQKSQNPALSGFLSVAACCSADTPSRRPPSGVNGNTPANYLARGGEEDEEDEEALRR